MNTGPDRYAVIGNPVGHSLSPRIHAAFAAQTGQTMAYGRLHCELDAFAASARRFFAEGGRGLNVTLPFKGEAYRLAGEHSRRAGRAEACNTLAARDTGRDDNPEHAIFGDNTDGAGLVRDIEQNAGVPLAGTRVLLIGAGGAAAGVVAPLLDAGVAELVIANRTARKAQMLAARHARAEVGLPPAPSGDGGRTGHIRAAPLDDCGTAYDVVVNASASSVADAPVPVAASVLRDGTLALDMMYGPQAAPFLAWAAAHGARGRDGLGMLVEQAAESFHLWRGVRPDTAPVLAMLAMPVTPVTPVT